MSNLAGGLMNILMGNGSPSLDGISDLLQAHSQPPGQVGQANSQLPHRPEAKKASLIMPDRYL